MTLDKVNSINDVIQATLSTCKEHGIEDVSPKKLQKLLYYLHVWHLHKFNKAKLTNEEIQAWRHGPVIPKVYFEYKHYGRCSINIDDTNFPSKLNGKKDFFNDVITLYGEYTGNELEELTHSEFPWKNARVGLFVGESSSRKISNTDMLLFCKKKLQH